MPLDRRQRGQDDLADELQAGRSDVLERVVGVMPLGVVDQVDQVDGGDPGAEERHVVVADRLALLEEHPLVAARARGNAPEHRPSRLDYAAG